MNVSLQKLLLGMLFLLAVPLFGWGQEVSQETYRNTPLEYIFASHPYNPSVLQRPVNGTMQVTDMGQSNYKITYTPNQDFVGNDLIKFTVWSGGTWEIRRLAITVLPSWVNAKSDLAFTYQNTSVNIDVLANDEASSGALTLKSILLVNNGDAQLTGGDQTVLFTPAEGFSGIAQLNYVVCDDFGTCDQGTVSITVLGSSATVRDTMQIFAKKNQPQSVLLPREFPLLTPPTNGTYDASKDLPTYTPDPDFTGTDFMTFSNGDQTTVVEMIVLDIKDNVFAFDDDVYTTSYDAVEFNVLNNDFYGASSGCLTVDQPEFGSVEVNPYPEGSLSYIPKEGFQGIDRFTYSVKPPNCNGEAETATVYVYVSNFEPAHSKFKMVTPKHTPLIIGYNVPIRNFEFEISDPAETGSARFLQGRVDTVVYGRRIEGYNIILYIPGENVTSGTDEFEIEYCVTKNGNCQFRKFVKIEVDILDVGDGTEPLCFDDCIWSGDTNFDGIVNVEDLLPIGEYMGKVGVPRVETEQGLWYGQYGEDWGSPGSGWLDDLKHVDSNGDSLVSARDTTAISQFYGNTHAIAPARVPDSKYRIELHGNVFASPGDTIELDMVLGNTEVPVSNVYGFTFPFEYNPDFFVPQTAQVEYKTNSWLTYGSPVLFMTNNNGKGLVESGFTRTNGKSIAGFGNFGKVRIVIEDDIAGFRPDEEEVTVDIGGGVATVVGAHGHRMGVEIEKVTIHINLKGEEMEEEDLMDPVTAEKLLQVFPNPTRDFLNVRLGGGHEFSRIMIYNLNGQQLFDSGSLQTNAERIDLSRYRDGIYLLSVQAKNGVIRKKFQVIR